MGMGLARASLVKPNRQRSGVGHFCSLMHKWDLVPFLNCECGVTEQTTEHIISQSGQIVFNDETRC